MGHFRINLPRLQDPSLASNHHDIPRWTDALCSLESGIAFNFSLAISIHQPDRTTSLLHLYLPVHRVPSPSPLLVSTFYLESAPSEADRQPIATTAASTILPIHLLPNKPLIVNQIPSSQGRLWYARCNIRQNVVPKTVQPNYLYNQPAHLAEKGRKIILLFLYTIRSHPFHARSPRGLAPIIPRGESE